MSITSLKKILEDGLRITKENAFYVAFFVYRLAVYFLFPVLPGPDNKAFGYFLVLIAVIACYRKDHLKLIRAEALCMLLNLLSTIPYALAGLTDAGVYTERTLIRSGLGTGHPNWLSADLFSLLVLLYIGYLIRSRIHLFVLTACVYMICEYITRTRTVSLLCMLFAVVVILEWRGQRTEETKGALSVVLRVTDGLSAFAFPVMSAICIGLVFSYPKDIGLVNKINYLLANRVKFAGNLVETYGVSPFGSLLQGVESGGTEMQYISLLVRIGLIGLIAFGILWVFLSLRSLRAGNRRLLYVLALYAVYGATEGSMLDSTGNTFLFLLLSDMTTSAPEENAVYDRREQMIRVAASAVPVAVMVFFMPLLFDRMRTIAQLVPEYCTGVLPKLRMVLSFFVLFAMAAGISSFLRTALLGKPLSRRTLSVTGVCAGILLAHLVAGGSILHNGSGEVQKLIDADAKAMEIILDAKSGTLYADPYPVLYRKQYPGIGRSVLYGKDLARKKNISVLTDIDLDGGNTFQTQAFQYIPVSDAHAVYTNDAMVISALQEAGFAVSPFYNRLLHVDLEQCAKDSYLVYEPSFPGIVIDQASNVEAQRSQTIWTNYHTLHGGSYEVTFTCRLLWPEENEPDESTILAVNYAHGGEIAQSILTPDDRDENNYIIRTIRFQVPHTMHGSAVSFSVYGGNIRRLVVEDISFIRVG